MTIATTTIGVPMASPDEFQAYLDIQPAADHLAEKLKAEYPYGVTTRQTMEEACEGFHPEVVRWAVNKVILDQTPLQAQCQCGNHANWQNVSIGQCQAGKDADAEFQRRQEAWEGVSFADRQTAYERLVS